MYFDTFRSFRSRIDREKEYSISSEPGAYHFYSLVSANTGEDEYIA